MARGGGAVAELSPVQRSAVNSVYDNVSVAASDSDVDSATAPSQRTECEQHVDIIRLPSRATIVRPPPVSAPRSDDIGYVRRLNVMVAGAARTGKTDLIHSLLRLPPDWSDSRPDSGNPTTRFFRLYAGLLTNKRGREVKLRMVESPGLERIVTDFTGYHMTEKFISDAARTPSHLLHLCIFCINSADKGFLTQRDVRLMKKVVQQRAKLVPVITKADNLTDTELARLRQQLMISFRRHNIPEPLLLLPMTLQPGSAGMGSVGSNLAGLPFAVVGSRHLVSSPSHVDGPKLVRGRQYPWGTVNVENARHCDTFALRTAMLQTDWAGISEKKSLEPLEEEDHNKFLTL